MRGKLFLYALVAGIIAVLSIFVFIIGAVVAVIVLQLASIKIYRDLQAAQATEEEHHEEQHDDNHHESHHG